MPFPPVSGACILFRHRIQVSCYSCDFKSLRGSRIRHMKRHANTLGLMLLSGLVGLVWFAAAQVLPVVPSGSGQSSGVMNQSHRGGARFVFADLDGDQKPDLALVEMQSQRSARTTYSIHVKLSEGAESAIGVNAPRGGLQLAARDVNGDDSLDLIVTSNLDSRFIEVLLNDGRGNFSQAALGDFPQLENDSDVFLQVPAEPPLDRATLASIRSSHQEGFLPSCGHDQVLSSDACPEFAAQPPVRRVAPSCSGRSPPPIVVLS